jgi:hypothetical protein
MKLTRERKIICTVLLLALGALAADRTLFAEAAAGGVTADSATLVVSAAERTVPPSRPPDLRAGMAPARVAKRLEQLASRQHPDGDAEVDIFAAAWQQPALPTTDKGKLDAAREVFARHKLTSLVGGGRGGAGAMIDGKYLRVGQILEGYTLVSIAKNSAKFEGGEVRVCMTLDGQTHITRGAAAARLAGVGELSAPQASRLAAPAY